MHAFDYYSPTSLPEAIDLLNRFNNLRDDIASKIQNPKSKITRNGQAHIIAGGSDLLIKMKKGLITPAAVINIKRLPELKGVSYSAASGLRLGALTTLGELNRSPIIQEHYPCLAQTTHLMASRQIRNFATLGGNLCNASPSADTAPPLIAYGAIVHLMGMGGERDLPLEDFFLGPGQTALAPGELLCYVTVPPPDGETLYLKHVPRAYMDISVVGVCACLKLRDNQCQLARIVLGAVAPTPIRVRQAEAILTNQRLTPAHIDHAARLAAEESRPIDDTGGSAWYRRRMVEVGTRRCLERILDFRFWVTTSTMLS